MGLLTCAAELAQENLQKCNDRWTPNRLEIQPKLPLLSYNFDVEFPEHERLPRKMRVEIRDFVDGSRSRIELMINGVKAGDHLTDNAYVSDGYRFHDVFHLAYAAILGWSPVVRSNLKRKRKSNPRVDEVEDGGRAIVIEEGISALVFHYASQHNWLENVNKLDGELLRVIKGMAYMLETGRCSRTDWEKAILQGYEVWREIRDSGGGSFSVDMDLQEIKFLIE